MKTKFETDESVVEAVKLHMDKSLQSIDEAALERLRNARLTALQQAKRENRFYASFHYWMNPARVAIVAIALLAVSLWVAAPKGINRVIPPADLEVIAAPENQDLIKELDFYYWLTVTDNGRNHI